MSKVRPAQAAALVAIRPVPCSGVLSELAPLEGDGDAPSLCGAEHQRETWAPREDQ